MTIWTIFSLSKGYMKDNPEPTKHANEVLFSCKKSIPNHPHSS